MKTLLSLLLLCSMAGCLTMPPPLEFTPDPGWETRSGQLQFTGRERSVIGEVLISSGSATNFYFTFSAGPGFPLLEMRREGDELAARGAFARGRWSGKTSETPEHLRPWLAWAEQAISHRRAGRHEFAAPGTGERFVLIAR